MNKRRRLNGTVTSANTAKTVSVEVSRTYQHPLYHKVVRGSKIYKAHDEQNCRVGDKVTIVECAPLSATKHWIVEKIIKAEIREAGELDEISGGDAA